MTERVVVFGEVLFDCFGEERVLGGAPFNVAWHLQGFGLTPLFVSRVGDDADGRAVLAAMEAWGMDRAGVQRDPIYPTGRVQVTVEDGEPRFDILPDQAYDFVDAAGLPGGAAAEGPLYHGTLALRAGVSRSTLGGIRRPGERPVFVDVNLRAPWWDAEGAMEAARGAACVKLNIDELDALAPAGDTLEARARELATRLGMEVVVVTRGAAGATVVTPERVHAVAAPPVAQLVDTVGAGDAFASVCLLGMVEGWPWAQTLTRAAGFAAHLCGRRGATADDRELYRAQRAQWADG